MPPPLAPAVEMLGQVRAFLESEIMPTLRDDKRFNLRIACNLLAVVEREIEGAPEAVAAEMARLEVLVGANTLAAMNVRLADAIRSGVTAADDPRLLDHLRRTTDDALAINNPRWLAPQKGN